MVPQNDPHPLNVRTLLESAGFPFAVVDYQPRMAIYFQGDPSTCVMYVERGRVQLSVTTPDGREAICGLLESGAFLGEEVVADQAVRCQTATAMTATEVLVVARAEMVRLLHTHQALSDRFMTQTIARRMRLEEDLIDQLLKSAEQRLARTLLLLAGCGDRRLGPYTLPKVSQEIIAEMVGTTRSRVNRLMSRFKDQGFIRRQGTTIQIEPSFLNAVHDGYRAISYAAAPATASAGRTARPD